MKVVHVEKELSLFRRKENLNKGKVVQLGCLLLLSSFDADNGQGELVCIRRNSLWGGHCEFVTRESSI